jgi:hypothetical protein
MDDEWVYPFPFSYIHGRLLVFAFTDPIAIFRKAFNALEPGGWFEMQDPAAPLRSIDGSIEGTTMIKASRLLVDTCMKRGIDLTSAARYKAMMEEVGFVDVNEIIFEWPIGTWAKSKYHKTIGAWFLKDMVMAMEGLFMGLFTRVLGMKPDEVKKMVEDVNRDLHDKNIHSYQAL